MSLVFVQYSVPGLSDVAFALHSTALCALPSTGCPDPRNFSFVELPCLRDFPRLFWSPLFFDFDSTSGLLSSLPVRTFSEGSNTSGLIWLTESALLGLPFLSVPNPPLHHRANVYPVPVFLNPSQSWSPNSQFDSIFPAARFIPGLFHGSP